MQLPYDGKEQSCVVTLHPTPGDGSCVLHAALGSPTRSGCRFTVHSHPDCSPLIGKFGLTNSATPKKVFSFAVRRALSLEISDPMDVDGEAAPRSQIVRRLARRVIHDSIVRCAEGQATHSDQIVVPESVRAAINDSRGSIGNQSIESIVDSLIDTHDLVNHYVDHALVSKWYFYSNLEVALCSVLFDVRIILLTEIPCPQHGFAIDVSVPVDAIDHAMVSGPSVYILRHCRSHDFTRCTVKPLSA